MMNGSFSIFPLGDAALVIDFEEDISVETNKKIIRLFQRLSKVDEPFITDLVPAYSSLAVYFNPLLLQNDKLGEESSFDLMVQWIEDLAMEPEVEIEKPSSLIQIPVCYHASFAWDLEACARHRDLSTEDFISIHTSQTYRVFMLGFLPGFPYMGIVDERIAVPRKSTPRKQVPAGSVGIAGKQTGIYSLDSPGGWQVIGRTPVQLFDKDAEQPVLLKPGDEVKFYSITENEFADYQGRNF